LIIEGDGSVHDKKEEKEYDAEHQWNLEKWGYKVLRFSNELITKNLD